METQKQKDLIASYDKLFKKLGKHEPEWYAVNLSRFDIEIYLRKAKYLYREFNEQSLEKALFLENTISRLEEAQRLINSPSFNSKLAKYASFYGQI